MPVVTDAQDALSSGARVIIVYADWCPHCSRLKETLSKENMMSMVYFLELDNASTMKCITSEKIESVPRTFVKHEDKWFQYRGQPTSNLKEYLAFLRSE